MTGTDRRLCFVIMPFGDKVNIDSETIDAMRRSVAEQQPIPTKFVTPIDFDLVFADIIEAAATRLGFNCVRCDRIKGSGSIHEDMVHHICKADVVVVDISTLNANVFYELGVRHTLQKKVTVLIQRKGTVTPFNIQGYRVITYDETTPTGIAAAVEEIASFIQAGLQDYGCDSPIYKHLPTLRAIVASAPPEQRILEDTQFIDYVVAWRPGILVGFVTGDIGKVRNVDVWVNSENVNMQMARFHDPSISGAIRWLGARKHPLTQRVLEDTIALELASAMDGTSQIDPGVVIPTDSGALLATNGVKRIFHAGAVTGQPRRGYRSIPDVGVCVTNALELMDQESPSFGLESIAFPLLGSGAGGRLFSEVIRALLRQILAYLEKTPNTRIKRIYLLAPIAEILAEGMKILDAIPGLARSTAERPHRQ
ncbi:MAG: macro domain-containing protein [Pseudonocardiaceae bacterium]